MEDNRSKIQKLLDLIDHPGTEETLRAVARERLEFLQNQMLTEIRDRLERLPVYTNVTEQDLTRPFITGVPLGNLYENLALLSPTPNVIEFTHRGDIHLRVPPPFMGKTKRQYVSEILGVCPGARDITSKMLPNGAGYLFTISYI